MSQSNNQPISNIRDSFFSKKNFTILKDIMNDYSTNRYQEPYDARNDIALFQMMEYEVQKINPKLSDQAMRKPEIKPFVIQMNKHVIEQMISFINKQNLNKIPKQNKMIENMNAVDQSMAMMREINENRMKETPNSVVTDQEPIQYTESVTKRFQSLQKERTNADNNNQLSTATKSINEVRGLIQPLGPSGTPKISGSSMITPRPQMEASNPEQFANTDQMNKRYQVEYHQRNRERAIQESIAAATATNAAAATAAANAAANAANPFSDFVPIIRKQQSQQPPPELPNFSMASSQELIGRPGAEPSVIVNKNDTLYYRSNLQNVDQYDDESPAEDIKIQKLMRNTQDMSIRSNPMGSIPVIRPTQSKNFAAADDEDQILPRETIVAPDGSSNQELLDRFDKRALYAKSNIILPVRTKLTRHEYFITVDSQDRNLAVYPQSTHFQLVFNPAGDTVQTRIVTDGDNNLIYQYQEKFIGDAINASIPSAYANILEMQCINAMIPHSEMWVCGLFPYLYNGPRIDENSKVQYQFGSMPFGPIWQDDIGIPKNVLSEPYLIMKIDELVGRGPYKGTNDVNTNAFAKLVFDGNLDHKGRFTQFIKMKTMGNEMYRYSPSALGRLDRWTIRLMTNCGEYVNFGPDKSYIQSICPGNLLTRGQTAPEFVGKCSTRFTISRKQLEYTTTPAHCLIPGDKLYFYNSRPQEFTPFASNVMLYEITCCEPDYQSQQTLELDPTVISLTNQRVLIKAQIMNETKYPNTVKLLNFRELNMLGNYFVMQYQIIENGNTLITVYVEYLKICGYDSAGNIITDKPQYYDPNNPNQEILVSQIGFATSNPSGIQTDSNISLFRKCGWFVSHITPTANDCPDGAECADPTNARAHCGEALDPVEATDVFEINYPFDLLSKEYQTNYYSNDFFFIKQRLQISYTFRIVCLEKDPELLEASIDD
jgi:hypothetical protein